MLYNYTYELYYMGHLDEAARIAKECEQCANGYNLQLLTGDIHQMQGDSETAITHYQHAHHMCPIRFAPLSGLLQTYQQMSDTYELRYWNENNTWTSCGIKEADSNVLHYDDVPQGALMWIINHTRGMDERAFLIDEEGNVEWW